MSEIQQGVYYLISEPGRFGTRMVANRREMAYIAIYPPAGPQGLVGSEAARAQLSAASAFITGL